MILPTAEPFYFPGDSQHENRHTGCLLIHGFTGTPKEMRPLGERLSKQGYTVLGIRLAGHATTPDDMRHSTWRHWAASVEDGYHLLRGHTRRVVLLGLSMGGVLAFYTAARLPVAGVVAMATPHHLPEDWRLRILPLLALFRPYDSKGAPQWVDQDALKSLVTYPVTPTISYKELWALLAEMRAHLDKITVPTALIYSRQDPTVRAEDGHMQAFAEALRNAPSVAQHWIEGSGHILPADAQRETVANLVQDFLQQLNERS